MKKQKVKNKDFGYYLFQVLRFPVKWYMKSKLNLLLVKNEAKDDVGPFFITGNHVTAYDSIIALAYLKPLVKWVAADTNYDNKLKSFLMKIARVIPIEKRNSDLRTIKHLISEVKAGNSVGIYPEGGRNWTGETEELIMSTAKLIKLLGIRVYVQKLEGAYMTSPRWGKTLRKGVTNVTIYKMLSDEEVLRMSADEIGSALISHLYHNDYEHQRKANVLLEGKDHAEYIERLIYVCPICHEFHSFKSQNDDFKCTSCQAIGHVNHYGFIEGDFPYDNLVDWYHFEKAYLINYLQNNKLKPIEIYEVIYKTSIEYGKKEKYFVNMIIEQEKIILDFEQERKIIYYRDISEPSITFKNTLVFFEDKIRHQFLIEPFLHNNASIMYIKDVITYLKGVN